MRMHIFSCILLSRLSSYLASWPLKKNLILIYGVIIVSGIYFYKEINLVLTTAGFIKTIPSVCTLLINTIYTEYTDS